MSETILDHGYIPEEHAPDPVIGHGDPTAPGKIGIWFFLASEIMFFIAILGSYIVFRSGAPGLFSKHAFILSKTAAGINTVVLIFSSLTMALAVDASQKNDRRKTILCLSLTLACALAFLGIKAKEYYDKAIHHTMIATDSASFDKTRKVYDGHVHEYGKDKDQWELTGVAAPLADFATKAAQAGQGGAGEFNIHLISESDIREVSGQGEQEKVYYIKKSDVGTDVSYGPWKNLFFACYFTLTGIHGLHVVGGMFPLTFLLIQACRGKLFPAHTENTGLYWHFVDLVWIFLFPLLYLI